MERGCSPPTSPPTTTRIRRRRSVVFVIVAASINEAGSERRASLAIMEGRGSGESLLKNVDVRLKSPFTAMVVGGTGSGKTVALMHLLRNARLVATEPPAEIIYCYGAMQPAFEEEVSGVRFHEGLVDARRDVPNDGLARWIVVDDLMTDVGGGKDMEDLFTKHSHHRNISVFFVVQNAFRKENRTISLNAQYFFLFKNPRDGTTVSSLARQMFPDNVGYLKEAYALATREPYSYLLVDLRQTTPDYARLIGNLFSSTRPMILYAPSASL